jgi:Fe-S-cluster-containing hydrogenase component 2
LVALVMRMHADDVRSPSRSVANLEFHRTGHAVDAVAHRLAVALSARGHRAINPSMAFPMEMEDFPGRTWVVAHKTVAVAAQLGRIGLHRSVIHPRFGSFILLGTVVTTAPLEGEAQALEYNPCVTCKLCVAACPVGAIEPDGTFRFSACYDHNYREFMTGFSDFAEQIADAKDGADYRARVPINESASMWQSLAYGPNYKAAHCIAVCPAGEDVLAPFLLDRAAHRKDVLQPLTEKSEPVYVVEGSDAQAYVAKRFPHKPVRVVRSSLGARDARGFFRALPLVFQRGPAKGWSGTFHFALTGPDAVEATVRIADGTLEVSAGLLGEADVRVDAPGRVWLDIVAKRRSPVVAVLTRKLKLRGDRSLLDRFAACFPR